MDERRERLRAWDRRLVEVAKRVKVLSAIAWPEEVVRDFVARAERGERRLPEPPPAEGDLSKEQEALEALAAEIDRGDPAGRYLADTAESYALAARMLGAAHTPEFRDISVALYGQPGVTPPGAGLCPLAAARELLERSEALQEAGVVPESAICITAHHVREVLAERFDGFFSPEDKVDVVVEMGLASKAAAGATKVRVRGGTCFSNEDIEQLTHHEGFVHTATAVNGRKQPVLTSLGLGAPRTTFTQEGIATFAELATRAIDISRLRRLALRIEAVDMALSGADYVEVYEHVLDHGQSPSESAQTAMRVFRGGDVRGGVAFTKDVVYLNGLIAVSTYLRAAVQANRPDLIESLFLGRLTLADALALEEPREAGLVERPRYVPDWARHLPSLTAFLAFGTLVSRIDMDAVRLDAF